MLILVISTVHFHWVFFEMAKNTSQMSLEESIRKLTETYRVQTQRREELHAILGSLVTKINIVEGTHKDPLQASDVEFVTTVTKGATMATGVAKQVRLEFPKFEGDNPMAWIF